MWSFIYLNYDQFGQVLINFWNCITSINSISVNFFRTMSLISSRLRLLRNTNWAQVRQMAHAHTDDDWKKWKKVFFFVACPVIVLGHVAAFVLPDAAEHEPPPFVPYDHLRIRYMIKWKFWEELEGIGLLNLLDCYFRAQSQPNPFHFMKSIHIVSCSL